MALSVCKEEEERGETFEGLLQLKIFRGVAANTIVARSLFKNVKKLSFLKPQNDGQLTSLEEVEVPTLILRKTFENLLSILIFFFAAFWRDTRPHQRKQTFEEHAFQSLRGAFSHLDV